jgi:protein ImuA
MPHDLLLTLRERVRRIEQPTAATHGVLPFGVAVINRALPGGGLMRGALHEILGAGGDEEDGALAAAFAAGIVARLALETGGIVLWCLARPDLYGPGLAVHGLDPARLVMVRAVRDAELLWAMEEGLRSSGIAAVVGEVGNLPDVASRRLQLAAERSGITVFVLRRWCNGEQAARKRNLPSAAVTRWRIAALPSQPIPVRLDAPNPPLPLGGHGVHTSAGLPAPLMGAGQSLPLAKAGGGGDPAKDSAVRDDVISGSLSSCLRLPTTAAFTPSPSLPHRGGWKRRFFEEPGIGHPRWRVELLRCRGGVPACWTAEVREGQVTDATDTLPLAQALADRMQAPVGGDVFPPERIRHTG